MSAFRGSPLGISPSSARSDSSLRRGQTHVHSTSLASLSNGNELTFERWWMALTVAEQLYLYFLNLALGTSTARARCFLSWGNVHGVVRSLQDLAPGVRKVLPVLAPVGVVFTLPHVVRRLPLRLYGICRHYFKQATLAVSISSLGGYSVSKVGVVLLRAHSRSCRQEAVFHSVVRAHTTRPRTARVRAESMGPKAGG